MKKTVLFFILGLHLLMGKAMAQVWPCTPDTSLNYNSISPETLPDAMAGYLYWTVLSFKIPRDSAIITSGSSIGITIDSARFLYASGKPAQFNFFCDTKDCVWPGGGKGCALFTGKVDSTFNSSVVEYPMKIYIRTWFRFTGGVDQFSRIDSATNYVFRINTYNGLAEIKQYETLKAYPNPTSGTVNIELRNLSNNQNEVSIMDAFGKEVYHSMVENTSFLNNLSVDLSHYPKGLYFVILTSGDKTGQAKVILE